MIEKFWLVGILIALSSFGIKVGLGATAIIYDRFVSLKRKIIFLSATYLIYFSLFLLFYLFIINFELLKYFDYFIGFMNYGMILHILVAVGIFYWGIKLLIGKSEKLQVNNQKGVLLLILPCPVCMTVIFFTLSFSYKLFSFSQFYTTGILFIIFISFSLLVILLTLPLHKKIINANSSFLGLTMVMIAIYFLLLILIAPVYQETKELYNKIISNTTPKGTLDLKFFVLLLITMILLFTVGMIIKFKNKN